MSAIRDAARNERCTVNAAQICLAPYDVPTVVLAHLRWLGGCGMGLKPDDLQAVFACLNCHDAIDGRRFSLSQEDRDRYVLRALVRTHRILAKKLRWKL